MEANIEDRPISNGLDWDKLFKMAEDPDLEDLDRGPIETAIAHLEGKEVHKLSAIRNLGDLFQSEGEDAIQRVLPAVQRALSEERSNLDLHCEAAIVFKGIIQNDKLLSAAAWLETLVDVAERVSLESVKQCIVPVVQQQAEPAQRVQRRIIATKLLQKLADILPANEVRKELGPCAQILCQDANANVRTSMAQRLPVIAKALKNSSDVVSLLLPCFVQLYKDDDVTVKEACMNNIAQCIPHFTNEAKKNTVFPLIKKSTEQSLEQKDETLMVIAKNFGEWCYTLRDVLDKLDLCWVLNTYCKIGQAAMVKEENATQKLMLTMCRRMTGFNLPVSFSGELFFLQKHMFLSDDEVRLSLASSYHEILMQHDAKSELLQPFIELIRGGSPEVVAKLTLNMDKILPILYGFTTIQLDRILIGCNQLLRGTGAWRSHAALLENISVLKTCLPYTQLADTFIPVLQKEVLQARAIPCRVAAVNTLLQFMREQPDLKKREEIIDFFKIEVAGHQCCYRRMLYLDVVECVLKIFSRKFFIKYFLEKMLSLIQDKVSNIRLRTIRMLPLVKKYLILPDDEEVLLSLEKAVREVLTTEKQGSTRQLLQAACELSRTEARAKSDKEDAAREKEEERLWSQDRDSPSRAKTDLIRCSLRHFCRSSESRNTSPWRTQRRAVAVVRPQPVVVMRSVFESRPCCGKHGCIYIDNDFHQFRSSSNLRRPSYSLSRVSSQSTLERKPGHLSMKVRTADS
ncbi:unnamed protein product [Haemonchus placei]|uniref:HEAT repeat-containing protein 3 n=1 Tax=Haemonchus placei TaxID=6290 RepID=A0A0N4WIB6_HAEPC|nr:unnamed protein product [Haemonchus placei]